MTVRYPITLNVSEPNNNIGLLKIRQADEETQTLVVQILEDATPKSYEGLQVFFCAKIGQTDGLGIIEQKLHDSEMTDPKNGQLEYTFRPEDWQILGHQTGYFSFRKMVDDHTYKQQFSTRDFTYEVTQNIYSDGIREVTKDGSTYVWTFEDLLRLLKEFMDSGQTDFEAWYEEIKDQLSEDAAGNLMLLYQSLRDKTGKDTDFRFFEAEKSFMERVYNENFERGSNVKWFGAVGDGLTDDTDAIQAALNSNPHIIIPQGEYIIKKSINLVNNSFIEGQGDVLFNFSGAYNLFNGDTKSNLTFKNFKMSGNNIVSDTNPEAGNSGIYLHNCEQILVENVNGRNFGAWPIVSISSRKIKYFNCDCSDSVRQSGLAVSDCIDYEIANCTSSENFYSGIIAEKAGSNGKIHDNFCSKNKHGILVKDDGINVRVYNNDCSANIEMGIYTQDTNRVEISNNLIFGCGNSNPANGYGIYGKNTQRLIVNNNNIQNNNAPAIYLNQEGNGTTSQPTITNNLLKNNCLTYRIDNEAEVFIQKANDIVFSNNALYPFRRVFVVGQTSTFKQFNQSYVGQISKLEGDLLEILPFVDEIKSLRCRLTKDSRTLNIKVKEDMRVVSIESSGYITVASNGIAFFLNDISINSVYPTAINTIATAQTTYSAKFAKGQNLKLNIANTVNNDYIGNFEVEIFYI
ncbi:BppU family phage baseplate upper protein [Enterococcus gallinarum]|uniref:BppU family phage baseplate upper protein n=1 Tax=Enterococcus gallinarum TaxID=1353 RepID=UPI003D135CBC